MKRVFVSLALIALTSSITMLVSAQDPGVEQLRVSPTLTEISANQGEVVKSTVTLENPRNTPRTVRVTVEDFVSREDGETESQPNPMYSLSNWFTQSNTTSLVTIPSMSKIEYPLTFSVPTFATNKSYFGNVTFTGNSENPITSTLFINVGNPESNTRTERLEFTESARFGSQYGELKLRLVNDGDGVFNAQNLSIAITDADGRSLEKFSSTDSEKVLPNSSRDILVPIPYLLPSGQLRVTATTDDADFSSDIFIPETENNLAPEFEVELNDPVDYTSKVLPLGFILATLALGIYVLRKYYGRKS